VRFAVSLVLAIINPAFAGAGVSSPLAEKSATFKVVSIKRSVLECEDKQLRPTGKKWTSSACVVDLSTNEDEHIFSVTMDSKGCDLRPGDELKAKLVGSTCTARFQLECDAQGKPLHPPTKDLHQMSCDNKTSWFVRNPNDVIVTKRTKLQK
jgi:hypothetical protein